MRVSVFIAIISVILVFFSSCKKNNSNPYYGTITAIINDTPYTFNYNNSVMTVVSSGANSKLLSFNTPSAAGISLVGNYSNNIDSGYLVIELENANGNSINSNTSYSSNFSDTIPTDTTLAIIQVSMPHNRGFYSSLDWHSNPLIVIVDSVTNNSIKGTFSGSAFIQDNTGDTTNKIIITDGAFNIHI